MKNKKRLIAGVVASLALGAGAAAFAGADPSTYSDGNARAYANTFATTIPVPAGGNFDGIRWEGAGALTPQQIEFVVRQNVACQWYRAYRDGRETAKAADVIRAVPGWPGFQGTEAGDVATQVAAQLVDGQPGTLATSVLKSCDAAHEREVAYSTGGH